MAEKLTPQQKEAVENTGGKLLVSAAAGSGKTKVLVDRLMRYLQDPVHPANIDDFLIITYTKAAAAELRGKIAAKLSQKMAQEPDNRHLHRQFQRLYLTQISTVHAFCSVILKEYAYHLNIPGDFRVADENECAEIRQSVVEKVLEHHYETASEDPDFCAFVDSQGIGRDDRQVAALVLKVYDSARCHLNPEHWLQHCLNCTQAENITDACQTPYGQYLAQRLFSWLDLQIPAMERCALQAAEQGMDKVSALLQDTLYQLRRLRESNTWDDILSRKDIQFGTLRFPKQCGDEALAEQIKAVRNACKDGLMKQTRYFCADSARVLRDLYGSGASMRGLLSIVHSFGQEYKRIKQSRRILDFGDLEHNMLDLLLGTSRTGATAAAREIGNRYREIMVDEYQDSNGVQDAIFSALTRQRNNLFMVGDVKQSIYQFRLADPGIFLEKYAAYAHADSATPGEGRKVLLSRNFRSDGAVLEAVNDVFRTCMSQRIGGLDYGPEEALYEGIPHQSLGGEEVELYCIDVLEDTYAEEAGFVAEKIAEMLRKGTTVRGEGGLHPVRPEDIVILLRSPGSVGAHFQRALEMRGIRCNSGGGEDLLQTREIATFYALLQTIQNPLLDIPLIATLTSPIIGFTADDLAQIRAAHPTGSFYEALCSSPLPAAIQVVEMLNTLRQTARTHSLTELMESIIMLTHIDSVFSAMEHGKTHSENLHTFFRLAADFENGGRRDLGRFLEHLGLLEKQGLTVGADENQPGCVTIMSIHKSKGLEFPVVFLCGLSREFNMESQRAQILCHKELGIGMPAVDPENRLRYPTIAKNAIAARMTEDMLSEELRVLYVAMTRAKDRLLMTYASARLEKDLQDLVLRMDIGGMEQLISEAVCPGEWVLLTALTRTESGELFSLAGKPAETHIGDIPWGVHVVRAPQSESYVAPSEQEETPKQIPHLEQLQQRLSFHYPHSAAILAPSKQTATQLKGRDKDAEAAEYTGKKPEAYRWRNAAYRETIPRGAEYGTAIHTVMQYINYEACTDFAAIQDEISRLQASGCITPEQGKMVRAEQIAAFFQTSIGKQFQKSGNIIREFKFSILTDGAKWDSQLQGEQVLLQGVVDCAMIEKDGITVLDFKSDRVTEETVEATAEHYMPQISAYADALRRIYGLPIKAAYLYFFQINRFVRAI